MKLFIILLNIHIWYHVHASINSNFSDAWANFSQDSQLSHATFSITILDNSTGDIMFSFNRNVGLAPASTLKTITGAAAFHYLGTDYRYNTSLEYSGTIDASGTLDGYIYILGSGDPSLGSSRWSETKGEIIIQRWIDLIKGKGIKQCQGIILDLSVWPGQTQTIPNGYTWGDLGNYYGTGSSALNWRENEFQLFLSPGASIGDPTTLVGFDHSPPSVTIINEVTTGWPGTGDGTILYLAPDATRGYFRGTLGIDAGKNFSIGGAIPNSALFMADELRQGMNWPDTMLIKVIYEKEVNATKRTTLEVHQSPPLSEIIYWFEQASINMYGEVLLKTIAQKTSLSVDSILPVYCETQHNIEQLAVATEDGSGLSPGNRITTWAIARVLHDVRQREPWFSTFEQALPIINGIRMKSGYINNALSYAGYVNHYSFSIITNNFNGQTNTIRQKIWGLLNLLK